MKGNWKVSSYC